MTDALRNPQAIIPCRMLPHGLHPYLHRAAIVPTGVLLGGKAHVTDGLAGIDGAVGYGFPDHDLPGEWLTTGLGTDRGGGDEGVTIFAGVHVISSDY